MSRIILLFCALALAVATVGCGQPYMEETYYLDREFGKATVAAFDRQIAYPQPQKRDAIPEGLDGIHAEQVMDVHGATYGEEATQNVVLQMGVAGGK
jgi:hypothetical protein